MKHGSFRAVRLAGQAVFLFLLLSLTVVSVFGQEPTFDYTSIILEHFTGDTSHEWNYRGKVYTYDYDWAVDASKFTSSVNNETFPKLTTVPAWPQALYGVNRDNLDLQSLGLWGKFDRRGYNWVDLYPIVPGSDQSEDGPEPFEIPMPGKIQYLDMWVWGSNLNYYIEAHFRDHLGIVHPLYMGNLAYQGWKNLRLRIPNNIPQSKRILPLYAGLTFVKFRIWTTPMERVDNFYIYFNQMKVLTDIFDPLFDGNDLADPDLVQQFWAQN